MRKLFLRRIGVFFLACLLASSALAQDAGTDLSEGVFVEDEEAVDQAMGEEPAAQPESDLAKEEEPKTQTEEIAKDIVEEPEAPPAEFPYPGATEEGFETTALVAQDEPIQLARPVKITSSGEYFYGFKSSPRDSSASVRFGYFSEPPDIVNPDNGTIWEEIYPDAQIPTLFVDYEWMIGRKLGVLGLKATSGVFFSQGTGKFKVDRDEREDREPFEKYSFVMFPNQLTAIYRFQYWDDQPIVPYVEGGAGYFTFVEFRDDAKGTKFGGAAAGVAAGGVSFLMDWLDRHSVRQLDNDWGINHVWLIAEYRLIAGLNKAYDFSSGVLNAGVRMEF